TSNKKGMVVGSGGQRRKQLKGRGPTPRAEDRVGHPASRQAARSAKEPGAAPRSSGARRPGPGRGGSTEVVAGRNSVLEALRTGVPATALHVGSRMESDDR